MPTKKGGGGRQQNYDSHGRYCKTVFKKPEISKKEKARRKEETRRQEIMKRAKNSSDKYLYEVYLELEKEIPGVVLKINEKRPNDVGIGKREFDIIAKGSIIEIKSGKARRRSSQLLAQKEYCRKHAKDYYVYAPNILTGVEKEYLRKEIPIYKNINEIITKMKERLKIK